MYRCLYRGVGVLFGEVTLGGLVSVFFFLYRGMGVLYGEVTLGAWWPWCLCIGLYRGSIWWGPWFLCIFVCIEVWGSGEVTLYRCLYRGVGVLFGEVAVCIGVWDPIW